MYVSACVCVCVCVWACVCVYVYEYQEWIIGIYMTICVLVFFCFVSYIQNLNREEHGRYGNLFINTVWEKIDGHLVVNADDMNFRISNDTVLANFCVW